MKTVLRRLISDCCKNEASNMHQNLWSSSVTTTTVKSEDKERDRQTQEEEKEACTVCDDIDRLFLLCLSIYNQTVIRNIENKYFLSFKANLKKALLSSWTKEVYPDISLIEDYEEVGTIISFFRFKVVISFLSRQLVLLSLTHILCIVVVDKNVPVCKILLGNVNFTC